MKKISWVFYTLFLVISVSSCVFNGQEIVGSGNIITKDFNVESPFSKIDISSAFDIELIQGVEQKVTVIADENIIEQLTVEFSDGELEVATQNGISISPSKQMKLIITAPEFTSIELSGVCNVTSQQQIRGPKSLEFNLSGASSIDLDLIADKIEIGTSGVGTIDLSGKTNELEIKASGASNIHCYDLLAQDVSVEISGAGSANVQVNGELEVKVSGAGSVNYKGSPTLITKQLSGVGNLNKVD